MNIFTKIFLKVHAIPVGIALFAGADIYAEASMRSTGSNFSFTGPEVLKTDWSTRSLSIVDLDGDGLKDIIAINNDTLKIEAFYQLDPNAPEMGKKKRVPRNRWEPVLEDARFEAETVTIGFPMFDLAVGDLNGDGAPDLAYSAREVPLSIRYQNESGKWGEAFEYSHFEALGWVSTLNIVDLDADGDLELVALSADAVRVFHPTESGDPGEPGVYNLTGQNPFNLMLVDVTQDGLLDILYITTDGKQALTVREQLADSNFGPERRFKLERPVRGIRAMPNAESGKPLFCGINSRSGGLELFSIETEPKHSRETGFVRSQPQIYPVARDGGNATVYGLADFDGDGMDDVLISQPEAAELIFYPGREGGFGVPRNYPVFSGVSSLSIGQFRSEGKRSVALISVSEKILGLSEMDASGRISFPKQIPLPSGEPQACRAFDADNDGIDELVVIVEDGGDMLLLLMGVDQTEGRSLVWRVLSETKLEGVRRKPSDIRILDAFEGNQSGLMIFVPREAPVFLAADSSDPFTLKVRAEGSAIRESLLKGVKPSEISSFDVNGDGSNEFVVAKTGYARVLSLSGDTFEMVDQFNARRNEDVIATVLPLFEKGKLTRVAFYVSSAGEFQFLERDSDGVFRYASRNEVGSINLIDWDVQSDGSTDETVFLLAGEDRFWRFSSGIQAWSLNEISNYETDLEGVHFNHVEGLDLDGDGILEIVAVDGNDNIVEIVSFSEEDWSSRMYWEIFERNMHYQGRKGANIEPRQILSADLNGDKLNDLVFLVHDRILIYPQE